MTEVMCNYTINNWDILPN